MSQDKYNLVGLNIPASVNGPLPVPGKPVVTIDGQPVDHVQSVRVFADAKGNKPTVVTIEFYADVTGVVQTKQLGDRK